ncbi:MAG: hypothetical protein M3R13_06220 [Armatimonadota bacterium]|nr:hypothetical protein [Armatimonadota bacterium]
MTENELGDESVRHKVLSPAQRIARIFVGLANMAGGVSLAVLCKDNFPVNLLAAALGLLWCGIGFRWWMYAYRGVGI